MQTYSQFRPTGDDVAGLGLPERQEWYVAPCGRNRDSNLFEESNWDSQLEIIGGESEDVEVHRFGHWSCGWLEVVLVRPDSEAFTKAQEIENKLADYPLLNENNYSDRQYKEALRVWEKWYKVKDRIEYIEDNRKEFTFESMTELMSCVRGKVFPGDISMFIDRADIQ